MAALGGRGAKEEVIGGNEGGLGATICGGEPNFSILEVESTEDLCLTPQTGAVCSRGSTEEGSSGEEAVRQPAPPAVDVLGGNPQAAQNVAGESPRHAPQPAAAAPRPVPPLTNPSTVPLQKSNDSAFLGMENAPSTTLPETLPTINAAKEIPATVVGVSRPLQTSPNQDCSSSAEMQRLEAPLCPPLTADTQIDSTVQELQYGSQTAKEKILSNSQTNQIQPPREAAGLVLITGTKAVTLEYKPETGTNTELSGKEHTSGNFLPQSQIFITASSPSFPQSSVTFNVQDTAEHKAVEQIPPDQDAKSPLLPLPSTDSEIKQTDLSKTQPQIFTKISHDAREIQNADASESVEVFVDTSYRETQPPSAKILDNPKASESASGLFASTGKDNSNTNIQRSCEGEQQTDTSSDHTTLPERSSAQESSLQPCSAPSLYDTGIVVSLQAEQVVEAETSHSSDQISTIETQLTTREIVLVREETHISGDWSNIHLNQSYLVQNEDGSVCEAIELSSTGEPKLYEEGVQANLELHSQNVEVYEFCGLVEEVAEETVCASTSVQIPHSPGYEVNLFNALLDNSDENIETTDTVIISQHPLPLPDNADQAEACSNNSNLHNLSVKNTTVQHLVLEANSAGEVANSSEVCLVEVATVPADSFTNEEVNAAGQTQVSDSPAAAPQNQETEASTAGGLSLTSPVVASDDVSVSHVENQTPGVSVVRTTAAPCQIVTTETKQETSSITHLSGVINPKLLLLKPGETPLLKHPPSLLAHVSKQHGAVGKLANAHTSRSGTVSEECLPQTAPAAADSLCASVTPGGDKIQTQCSVNKTPVSVAPPVRVQQPTTSCNNTLHLEQAASVKLAPSATKSDKEALTVTSASGASDPVPPPAMSYTLYTPAPSAERDTDVLASTSHDDPISQVDSIYMEEESEDMEHDDQMDAHESVSGPEEGSDEEEADADKTESEMTTPGSPHKVRQWIAERVTVNSSPASPSTSSPYPGPSPSSDWSTPRLDKSSPLRGPSGKFVSPASAGGCSSSSSPPDQTTPQRPRGHADMAELAKHEADIEHRTQALKREGFWSMKRLTRLTEPPRPKVHWDYLCEEMQWLSADFAQERRWKRGVARKVVRMVMRHHEELRQKEEKAKRDEHAKIRRVASSIAKEVRAFWSSVEKVVQYKQQSRLEEKRKKALDLQLDFIVGQTEKYSDLLSKSLAPTRPAETVPPTPPKSVPSAADEDDRDFEPTCEEEDDEETIEVEEQQEGNDAESHRREIELLKEEGMLPLDQLLSTLKMPQESGSDQECSDESSSSAGEEEEDGEFTANEEDAEDEEDTIDAQEKIEGTVDHAEELDDLAREGDMSMEELLERYKGAYASDFEMPSASGSKVSSDSEVSGDEEEETEEDESDAESNTSSSDSPGDSAEDDSERDGEESDDDCGGMEDLLKDGDSPPSSSSRPKKEISHIAATAESLQPKGYTLATTKVKTPIPFLLHGTLREYQHIGLDWLVTMYEKKLNGILADEMGLGKTIQTIALLAHLACEKGNWGPHLIIVPTSVMLNWEMELKRWCPGFKILTYFGSQKERKLKRQGWTKPNAFHVCITSYKLVLQDHQAFRRKSWRYLILDEAQNIKNFKSQRWQSLLNFNSHRRLLLTGTPLQNSLMELWSLMHFLMPHVFQSHREFKEWFSNPLTGMIEGSQEYNEGLVKRLHKVLRPFLLRRIKVDVEKQMPKKYEHVVRCRLSKRQRFLYDDFMAQASTRETLASGHFMSVINILMQLRKVCNHPNLFDPRPIQSPFITQPIVFYTASLVQDALEVSPLKRCDLSMFDLVCLESRVSRYQADVFAPRHKVSRQLIQEITESPEPAPRPKPVRMKVNRMFQPPPKGDSRQVLLMNKPTCSVPPAAQTPKPPPVTETTSAPAPAPAVQQVVCSVAATPPPRPSMQLQTQTAVRSTAPKPVLAIRPPAAPCAANIPAHPSPTPGSVLPQRVLLSPDMQARLPSGEVVSIAQLASLAGRPVSSCQGSKPVTFQLQGNKLTLSGAQIHQVPAASARPVQGNVMHLVSSGVQHHLISQPAQVTVQTNSTTLSASTAPTAVPANRMPQNATAQVAPTMVSSPGVVKIVVRQSAGKEGGPVPTLAVAPSPRVAPQPPSFPHPHVNTTPAVRNTAPLQIAHRTPGPATAHYTIAPPGNPSSTPNQPHPPRPVLKVVQPSPSSTEQPAPTPVTTTSTVSKSSAPPRENSSSSNQTPASTKSKPSTAAKSFHPRKVPRPPPRSPFHMSWLADSQKKQRDSKLDLINRVNEIRCDAKPVYGREILDFLTFLHGGVPSPAALNSQGEWSRSGHSSCLLAQWQTKSNYWFQSHALREAIHSIEERLELLQDIIDRFTFAIPPVEAPPISMHCCHPPPSLSHKQAVFAATLSNEAIPLTRSLHRIQCYMRTQFPDLRLIQYDCGKLQTLHTLLRKLKTGGHRVLIFTQMTRMLDVLEQFLNYHGHIYLRLDGSTRVEQRQALMERFNADRRIFCFILSTRSGGVGVNLTGADTVVFYDSDWNPTMDAQAQDRCHRIGQTRDVHIYRLISERTVEENILKKANQKRMLGDMAIEGGNFTTAFFKEQTIRELFDVNDSEKREVAVELSVPQAEEEENVNKQSTTILEQALCRAEDEEDIVAASQAKAEQVAELAEFNENIPLDDGGEQEEVEELSKAEQEIAALVEQLTPIERYAMNFLEASLEDVCKEELKQAEEQVEAARKGLDQAKEEGLKLHASSDEDEDDFLSPPASVEPAQQTPARRGRKPKDKDKVVISTRTSGRLRGASPDTEPEPTTPREVPERLRAGLRGRGAAKDTTVSTTPARSDHHKASSSARLQDSSKSSKASSPARDHQTTKTRTLPNRSHPSPVPSPPATSPPGGKHQNVGETDSKSSKVSKDEKEREGEKKVSESSLEPSCLQDHQTKEDDIKDHCPMSPPSTSSRSPRKRQSADGEVLRNLVEDSPSAKVLRKLPGRLVTVVEEKEPKKRRRRASGTGGGTSSEETNVEENTAGSADEPIKDETSPSSDSKTKGTVNKSPQDRDPTPSSPVHPQPVRAYPPYSPPHLSPDMPVLRNLPVRRRLETESRMAAQLGEQMQHLGRGRGGNQSRKTDTQPGKDSSMDSSCPATSLKRKRGRPPKTPPRSSESDEPVTPSSQPTSPSEEGNAPLSPKRKRGRPPRQSPTMSVKAGEGQTLTKETFTPGVSDLSKTVPADPSLHESETPKAAATTTNQAQSTKADDKDTKTMVSADTPNPAQNKTDQAPTQAFTSASVTAESLPVNTTAPKLDSIQVTSVSTIKPSLETESVQAASVSNLSASCSAPVSDSLITTTPVSPARAVILTLSEVKPTLGDSTAAKASVEPTPSASSNVKAPEPAKSTTGNISVATTSAACLPATSSTVVTTTVLSSATAILVTDAATKTVNVTPGTSVQIKTAPAKDLPQAPQAPSTTAPSPAKVTPTPSANKTVAASSSSTSTSSSTTTVTAVKTSQASLTNSTSPSTVPTPSPPMPAKASSVPPVTTVTSSASTVPSSTAQFNVTNTKVPTKPIPTPSKTQVQLASKERAQDEAVDVAGKSSVTTSSCNSSPTSTSTSVTSTTKTETLTKSAPSKGVQALIPATATIIKESTTSSSPTTTAEKTAKIPSQVTTSRGTTSTPSPVTTSPLSSQEKSTTEAPSNVTTTQESATTPPKPLSVTTAAGAKAIGTTKSVPPVSDTNATSLEIPSPASKDACKDVSTPVQKEAQNKEQLSALSGIAHSKQSSEPMQKLSDEEKEMEVDPAEDKSRSCKEDDDNKQDICKSQSKRRRVESSSEIKDSDPEKEEAGEKESQSAAVKKTEEPKKEAVKQTTEDQKTPVQKRPLSRQSSQESTRSSSPSSGCSTSTLTRHAHHKKTYENRHPTKKRRVDVTAETGEEEQREEVVEKKEKSKEKETTTAASQRRRSRSSSFSTDSDSDGRKEHRLTRSAKRRLQDQEGDKGNNQQEKKPAKNSGKKASNNASVSTGGESGSDTSSVRITRKSAGSQPLKESKAQTNSTPSLPPEPEVLGKRCSALNAAAKLLAMKGRVDTPGHTPRKDSGSKTAGTSPAPSSDKTPKPKSKSVPASPQSNSVTITNNKSSSSKPSTPNKTSCPAPRSTRQCPGSLVPPLEQEYKRPKVEEKDKASRKSAGSKEGEAERQSSSRGHSACSSMSSDGEGDGHSSRSRSSSNSSSSRRTRSISSQNAENRESRATSSGSERSSDRAKNRDKKDKNGQQRESRHDSRKSTRLSQEVTSSSGTEGTPDRVLRSVAALAAVQARSPAASTRSSAGQHRLNKT